MEPARLLSALPLRRVAIVTASAALLTACAGSPPATSTPAPTLSPSPALTASPTAPATAQPSPTPTPTSVPTPTGIATPTASPSSSPSAKPSGSIIATFQVADEQYRVLIVDPDADRDRAQAAGRQAGTADPQRPHRARRRWRKSAVELAHRSARLRVRRHDDRVVRRAAVIRRGRDADRRPLLPVVGEGRRCRSGALASGARAPKKRRKTERPKEPAGLRCHARWRTSGPAPEIRGPFGTRTKLAGPARATQAHLSTKRFEFRQLFTKRPECRPQVVWKT